MLTVTQQIFYRYSDIHPGIIYIMTTLKPEAEEPWSGFGGISKVRVKIFTRRSITLESGQF